MELRRMVGMVAGLACLLAAGTPAGALAPRKLPYWASISEAEARMRVGPSFDYPANWLYRRRDLPVKVVQVLDQWRKIEDSTGTQGWMHVRLLSDRATAIVTADMAEMHNAPDERARLLYRAEKGVVGRVNDCAGGWCNFDVAGQRGYIRVTALWGAVR